MIDIRKLKELVRLMVENDLTELDLKDQEEHVVLRRGHQQTSVVNHQPVIYSGAAGAGVPAGVPAGVAAPAAGAPAPAPPPPELETDTPADEAATAGLHAIESPMVGTFYSAADPDSEPFASAGTTVNPSTVVCLVEAMKVFNEIKAECSGTIEKVLVSNGEPVEFGQKLFLVRPG